jgi:hypothetical protein
MDRIQARKLWKEIFTEQTAKARSVLLRELLKAPVDEIIKLAAHGRRRFDTENPDSTGVEGYLFAKDCRENTLFDVIELFVERSHRRRKLSSIRTFSEITVWRVPCCGLRAEFRATGNSGGFWLGKGATLGAVGSCRFVGEFDRAIPKAKENGKDGRRCIWTAEEAFAAFESWLAKNNLFESKERFQYVRHFLSRLEFEFSEEAILGLREQAMPQLRTDLQSPDATVRCVAFVSLSEFGQRGDEIAKVGIALCDSRDAAIRKEALSTIADCTSDYHVAADAILRGLRDPDRDVRWSLCRMLDVYSSRHAPKLMDKLVVAVAELLQHELDEKVPDCAGAWLVANSARYLGISKLCELAEAGQRPQLRQIAILRLGTEGNRSARVVRTLLLSIDDFPRHVMDALLALKVHSPRVMSKVERFFSAPDWSTRWRAVLFADKCPKVSKAIAKAVAKLVKDKEYTVRAEAQRVAQKFEKLGLL